MTTVRILIADDHEIVRVGLRSLLENQAGWEICGEATNGRQALEIATVLKPQIAILDVTMPEMNGLEATRQIRKASPDTEIIILTMHESDQMLQEVLAVGARGYVLKSSANRDLIVAIESICQHQPFFSSSVELPLGGRPRRQPGDTPATMGRLTPREREVIQLLAEGKSNKEVAALLAISVKTVEQHRTNIMRKHDWHSLGDLVRYAIRNHIIEA